MLADGAAEEGRDLWARAFGFNIHSECLGLIKRELELRSQLQSESFTISEIENKKEKQKNKKKKRKLASDPR